MASMKPRRSGETQDAPGDGPSAADARSTAWLRLAVVVLLVLSSITVALDLDSPLRTAVTIAFLAFGPGLAIAGLLALRDPVEQISIAIGASFAIETLVAITLFYLEVYSYELAFGIVAGITIAALAAGVLRAVRGPSRVKRPPEHAAT